MQQVKRPIVNSGTITRMGTLPVEIGIAPVPAAAFKAQDERQQVDAQRQHPQERNGRHVLRKMIGDGQQQHRGHGRQQQPNQVALRRRLFDGFRFRHRLRRRRIPRLDGRHAAQHHKQAIRRRPHPGLLMRREHRLEQHRVAQQCEHRAGIRERVQPVGHGALEPAGVPRL
jgi:hypothetical protein